MKDDEESGKERMYLTFVANHLSYHTKAVSEAHVDPLSNEVIFVILHLGKKSELLSC